MELTAKQINEAGEINYQARRAIEMSIDVRIISQFGNERVFPACPKAELFCRIAGTTTLTEQTIKAIKHLGYTVSVVQDVKAL